MLAKTIKILNTKIQNFPKLLKKQQYLNSFQQNQININEKNTPKYIIVNLIKGEKKKKTRANLHSNHSGDQRDYPKGTKSELSLAAYFSTENWKIVNEIMSLKY